MSDEILQISPETEKKEIITKEVCHKCGSEYEAGKDFCVSCGAKKKNPKKKRAAIISIILIVVIALSAGIGVKVYSDIEKAKEEAARQELINAEIAEAESNMVGTWEYTTYAKNDQGKILNAFGLKLAPLEVYSDHTAVDKFLNEEYTWEYDLEEMERYREADTDGKISLIPYIFVTMEGKKYCAWISDEGTLIFEVDRSQKEYYNLKKNAE